MKRTVILLIILGICISFSNAQTINKIVKDQNGRELLLGSINKEGLKSKPFKSWFTKNYDSYATNKVVIHTYKDSLKNYTIKVFLGTWCGDSRKEVPRFYSILDAANFPVNQLEVFALDFRKGAYKKGPNGEERGMNIHKVPTFIFYKNGEEVNRIVEHPRETFELDILKIITTKRYRSKYYVANLLLSYLETNSITELKEKEQYLLASFSESIESSGELNSLGYLFLKDNQTEKAKFIFDLNTKLFPYHYNVFDSLAEAYFETKNYNQALKIYYKALSLNPEAKSALEMVDKINRIQNKTVRSQ